MASRKKTEEHVADGPELRVLSVEVKDVLGAREFAMEPGRVTVLRGKNGTGKSTALAAVQAALGGGSLARLARVAPEGEEVEPEVVLVLAGPGSEEYRVERSGDKVRVRARVGDSAAFEDMPRPQGWLTGLFDPRGANPVAFLTAADKDRALMLLEALPLRMDRAELGRILSDLSGHVPPVPAGLHPLEELGLIRDALFRARTGVNRDQKGKAQAADQTRRASPAVVPANPAAEITKAEGHVAELAGDLARAEEQVAAGEREALATAQAVHDLAEQEVKSAYTEAARSMRAAHEKKAADLRADVERRIEEDRAVTEHAVAALKESDEARLDVLDAVLANAQGAAREARAQAYGALILRREEVAAERERLATLREQAENAGKARTLHEQAARFDQEAEELEGESVRLTAALDRLDAFRRQLAQDLPIEGLEIEGKEIRVHGIPYEQLNKQQRVEIAVRVATLRAKGQRLPVVFVDDAESLDTEHFGLLVQELKKQGVQAFLGRVEDREFAVEAIA